MRYTLRQLKSKKTLASDMTSDLKIESPRKRVWLARTGVSHGEPYNNKVTIERLVNGRWTITEEYETL